MATKRCGMSLVAVYDDINRDTDILLNDPIYKYFIQFAKNQEACRVKWQAAEQEVCALRRENEDLRKKNYELEIRYEHAREQIRHESQARERSEIARVDKENQLVLIREFVSDPSRGINVDELEEISKASPHMSYRRRVSSYGAAAESSASVLDDIDWDHTDDDIIASPAYGSARRRYNKRPSAPPMEEDDDEVLFKRRRGSDEIDIDVKNDSFVSQTTIRVNADGQPVEASTTVYGNNGKRLSGRLNKSFSESALDNRLSRDNAPLAEVEENDLEESPIFTPNTNTNNLRGILRNKQTDSVSTPIGLRKSSSAGKGLNKLHMFVPKNMVISETCSVCDKKMKFARILKCQGCNSTVHQECKDLLPLPCLPLHTTTPGKGKFIPGKLSDFVPLTSPMVPSLVVHCICEIERRGLQEVGLYRVAGSDKQVRELKEKFYRGKSLPNLSLVCDIHVICGILKDFLLKLKEPVITFKLWHDFMTAADHPHKSEATNQVCAVVNCLPQPNRDTLAYLILHLQRIAESRDCMMPASNLATIFGMSIAGSSSANPAPTDMMTCLPKQCNLIEQFLAVPANFWGRFVEGDTCDLYPEYTSTPGRPDIPQTRLGWGWIRCSIVPQPSYLPPPKRRREIRRLRDDATPYPPPN